MLINVQLLAHALMMFAGLYGILGALVGHWSHGKAGKTAVLKLFLEIFAWNIFALTVVQAIAYFTWTTTRPDFHFNSIDRALAENYYWDCNSCSTPMSLMTEVFDKEISLRHAEREILDSGYDKSSFGPKSVGEALAEGHPLVYEKEVASFACVRWFQLRVFLDKNEKVSDITGYLAGKCLL